MDIGLKHLFYAFALVWVLLLGYVVNLAFRLRSLGEELRALKEQLARQNSE